MLSVYRNYKVRAVDIKPFEDWYQCFSDVENNVLDMSIKDPVNF